ncbi:MAG: oxygen-independent coproporphyrinogen III oxidase [Planctomycetota bacterium]
MNITVELLKRYDRPGPRYTSFPPATEFHSGVGEPELAEHLERASRLEAPLSFYAHLPFCEERCLYCGCNVVITKRRDVLRRYLDHLYREIRDLAARLGERRRLSQYHLGGGTPTYLTPDELRELHGVITSEFTVEPAAEVAIEVDPRVTSEEHLAVLRELGFNRLSLGVQDFTREVQEAVDRVQSYESTRDQVALARRLGFESINIDLIYGLPFQKPLTFCRTLELLREIRPDRVAVYSYAHVPWIRGQQREIDPASLPGPETKMELFATAVRELTRAGYLSIGMDHFALPEDEMGRAVAAGKLWRNFMGYTVSHAPDMIGCGASGISDVAGAYFQNVKKLSRYEELVGAGRLPTERGCVLTRDDSIRRHVITSLMCNFTARIREIEDLHNIAFWEYFAKEREGLTPLIADGFVAIHPDRLDVVGIGRRFIRNVCMIFDPYLEKDGAEPRFSRTV